MKNLQLNFNEKGYKILIILGFFLGLKELFHSFFIFYENIDTLGKDNQWKFYASLIGFCLFLLLFLALIIVTIIKKKCRVGKGESHP